MDKLREFRTKNNLTPRQMSERMGISVHTYYKVEDGSREPTYRFIKRFRAVFKVSVDEIFFNGERHPRKDAFS